MTTTLRCPLPQLGAVLAAGPDARAFLQGQLTNDLLALDRHPGLLAAACSPQGRVLELLRLAATPAGVLLLLPRSLIPALQERLSKYVLRADLRLDDASDRIALAGLLDAPPDPSWTPAAAAAAGVAMLVASSRRILLAGAPDALDAALARIPAGEAGDWEHACIEDGEPQLGPDTTGRWLPQMLNLDLLGGLSFSKGCYTGQEVVARTQNLGRLKRRMLRYEGPAGVIVGPGQPLYAGAETAGEVVAAASGPAGLQLLAVVQLARGADLLGLDPGGRELRPAPLPYTIPVREPGSAA